mgnify:CR=1 FL=1
MLLQRLLVQCNAQAGAVGHATLVSLGYLPYRHAVRNAPELALDTLDTYNRWAAERLHGYTERLIPATVVDLADVDWSLRQLAHMRAAGSRVAWVKADPHDGKALNHPDFERFWSACEDLEMTVMFHVGGARAAMHPGWAVNGGNIEAFYRLRELRGIEKKPATRELINWIRALKTDPDFRVRALEKGETPFLGILFKKSNDLQMATQQAARSSLR